MVFLADDTDRMMPEPEPEPEPLHRAKARQNMRADQRAAAKAGGPRDQMGSSDDDAGGLGVVRIKPMGAGGGGGERSAGAPSASLISFVSSAESGKSACSVTLPDISGRPQTFTYPRHVMGPATANEALFEEFMPRRIEAFLDGYNANVMAYGQTGSGKTHTIFGPPGTMDRAAAGEYGHSITTAEYGIFPRTIWTIFERVRALNAAGGGCNYVLTASAIELGIMGNMDMLVKSADERIAFSKMGFGEMRRAGAAGPALDKNCTPPRMFGMVELPLREPEDVLRIFAAIASRNTSGTGMNDTSSRSHCFAWLTLLAHDAAAGSVRRSRFQFVDLAGSERQKEASADVDRAAGSSSSWRGMEGMATNWSLTMLSTAVRSITATRVRDKQKFVHTGGYGGDLVPLLVDSLTGKALTALFVCVSQAPANMMQSKISLEFGESFSRLTVSKKKQKAQPLVKLLKEVRGLHADNEAALRKGVKGKWMAVRTAHALDYSQTLEILQSFEALSSPS